MGDTEGFGGAKMSNKESKPSGRTKLRFMIASIIFIFLAVILLIPFVFKDKPRAPLHGPDLSEIEYIEVFFNNGDLQQRNN